jgi:glycosyltransferase involved in cell wall biosynthesis
MTDRVESCMPRVAYLVNHYPKVSHSFIRREIQALERRGIEIERYAVRGWEGATPDPIDADERTKTRYLLREGVGALFGPMLRRLAAAPARFWSTLGLALRLAYRADRPLPYHLVYFAEACLLCEWLQASGAQHLHAHFGTNAAEVALLVHALGGPPYSFTVHGPEEFDRPAALHLAGKVRRAAFVVAISSYGRSQLYRWLRHADWPKVEVVHCGIDNDFHDFVSGMAPQAHRLVCVGRLCEQKGQLLLIEALAQLVRDGIEAQLVLAGDGEMRGQIESRVRSLGLEQHVRITGWISGAEVRDEILAARALVLPSFAEGLPVVIMEAMALRRPVISTFVAGIPELVRDGEDGWLVPAGDVDGLAIAIRRCLASTPAELAAKGDAARARVLARHDMDEEAAKLARLYSRSPIGAAN